MVLDVIAILSIVIAVIILGILSKIDLAVRLLPNELVLAFAVCGLVFHLSTSFLYESLAGMLIGAAIGGGFLYAVRAAANYYYEDDALGLGDVKLMTAAGLWLGQDYILIGLTLGALAGLLHGLTVVVAERLIHNEKIPMGQLSIPAGPGFAVGIIAAALVKFGAFELGFIP